MLSDCGVRMTGQKTDAIKGYFCNYKAFLIIKYNLMMLICWSVNVKDDLGWSKVVNVLSVEATRISFPYKVLHSSCL